MRLLHYVFYVVNYFENCDEIGSFADIVETEGTLFNATEEFNPRIYL